VAKQSRQFCKSNTIHIQNRNKKTNIRHFHGWSPLPSSIFLTLANSSKTKTEFLLIGLKTKSCQKSKIHSFSFNTIHSARNPYFISEEHLTFSEQILLPKSSYCHVRQLRCIRPHVYLDYTTSYTVIIYVIQSEFG